jgi:hypothetical protein
MGKIKPLLKSSHKTIRDARVTIAQINQGGILHETGKVIQMKMNARSRDHGGEKINRQG